MAKSPMAIRFARGAKGLPVSRFLKIVAIVAALLLLSTVAISWLIYAQLDNNTRTDEATQRALDADHGARPTAAAGKAQNILLLGTDSEAGLGSTRADTTILLHLAANRRSASMTSVPRDLMVDIPACLRPEGGRSRAQHAQFNWAYQFGGAACTIRTFEDLTGIRIDHHLVADFSGFINVVDAVGGVEVDVAERVRQSRYGITLRPGRQTVNGKEALTFVRARLGVSDGSDLQRVERQKQFMHQLLAKISSSGTLYNPTRLYPVLDAVTSSLVADSGLDSPAELYSLVNTARMIPPDRVRAVTVPSVEDPDHWGRYVTVKRQAKALFKSLRRDTALPKHLYNAYRPDGRVADE
ncbi:LCP family protein [Streptomyces sp. NBC_01283]|uniref:LCP family protein n=1 Tax=Streptomyces sp. NBC_01283 TaxID=2903812 RepID=UPI00352E81B0|nr:LCP family protein [Streptomyces sp. NBC_01283]